MTKSEASDTTRRDFLRVLVPGSQPESWSIERDTRVPPQPLVSASRYAMGCTFEVLLPAAFPDAVGAEEAALDEVDRLDRRLSVYRPDSELSRLNAVGGFGPRLAGESVLELLALASRLTEETDGAFDPAVGSLVRAWGFDTGERAIPSEDRLAAALQLAGIRNVRVDLDAGTIELLRPGVELNFGAIGKGYALDRAATILREQKQCPSAFIQGGRSSAYAVGAAPGESRGWLVELRDPEKESDLIGSWWLRNEGLATSGAGHRFFEEHGGRWGHILDPRTGYPARGVRLVTVVAPTAAEADALSTAFFILGSAGAANYAARRPGVGAILLAESDSERTVSVVGGLDADFSPDVRVERIDKTASA